MTTFWVAGALFLLTLIFAELIRPRPRPPRPGERVKNGSFTSEIMPLGDFRVPRTKSEWHQFYETGETYAGQDMDEANPWRAPRCD